MKRSISALAALTVMAGVAVDSLRPKQVQANTQMESMEFYCDTSDARQPTTTIRASDSLTPFIIWKTRFFGPEYTPLERCRQVSARFQRFYREGSLKYITTGRINNEPVICISDSLGGDCPNHPNNLLMTLRPYDNSEEILKAILDVRDFQKGPLTHYCPEILYKLNGRTYIDVDELLEVIDGDSCRPTNTVSR